MATVIDSKANQKIRATLRADGSVRRKSARFFNEWVKLWGESYKKGTQEEVMAAVPQKAAGQEPREAHELNQTKVVKQDRARGRCGPEEGHRPQQCRRRQGRARGGGQPYASALMMLAVILAAVVIIGVAVSFYLVRDLSNGIASSWRRCRRSERGTLREIRAGAKPPKSAPWRTRLQVFKEALIAKKAADEAAAREPKPRSSAAARRRHHPRLRSDVGEIVETVSSASTELEASAAR